MPRRSGGGRAPSRGFSSVPARAPPAPAAHAPPPPAAVGQPRQPGLFAQMASTAAGVAVGSAVGHTIGAAMTGGSGGHEAPAPQQQEMAPAYQYPPTQQVAGQGPCQLELKQFLECAQSQSDINICYGFNEALKQCKLANGLHTA